MRNNAINNPNMNWDCLINHDLKALKIQKYCQKNNNVSTL